MFGMFKKIGIPPRHRQAAYMNLAFGITPVDAGFNVVPTTLPNLVDERIDTHITVDGQVAAGTTGTLIIDLGQIYEVYEIRIKNRPTEGFSGGGTADGTVRLTTDDGTGWLSRSGFQTMTVGFADADVDYIGVGIPVRYVGLSIVGGAATITHVDLSEIEVFGC